MRLLWYSPMLLQITFFLGPSAAQKLGDMEPLYIFTPGAAPGSCDQHKSLLQDCFSEAIDMVIGSINAINSLGLSASQLDTAEERSKWKTWAQLLWAIFRIPVDVTRGLNLDNENVTMVKSKSFPNASNHLVNIMVLTGYFEKMITYQSYKQPSDAPTKYWLFCDDSYFSWINTPPKAILDGWDWPDDNGDTRAKVEST